MRVSPASRAGIAPAHTAACACAEVAGLRTGCFRKFASYSREVSRASCECGVWDGPVGSVGLAPLGPPASSRSSSGRWVPGPQLSPGQLLLRAPPAPRPRPVLLRALGPGSRPLPRPTSSGPPPRPRADPSPGSRQDGGQHQPHQRDSGELGEPGQ